MAAAASAPAADDEDSVHQRFWGMVLAPGQVYDLSLSRAELHLTQAAVVEAAGAGAAAAAADHTSTLFVSTNMMKDIPGCTVSSGRGPRQALLDLSFFAHDASVRLRNAGAAHLGLAGSIAIFGAPPEEEEEEDEEEDEEEEEEEEEEEITNERVQGSRTS